MDIKNGVKMKTIYDDHHINMLIESIEDPVNKRECTRAQMLNEVSALIGIDPLAKGAAYFGGKTELLSINTCFT